jgi:hypothetical protein
MEASIIVAIISASASVIIAALTFALNKRAERKTALQQNKTVHYQKLLNAISDLAVDGTDKNEANMRFANAANTIALVAPQYVISALMEFHDEVKHSNPNKSSVNHDRKLILLLIAISKSLALPFKDDPDKFQFHLVGSRPKS